MHPLKTFIIYARKDESFKNDLLLHLKGSLLPTGHLEVWQDGEIQPGEAWEKKIEEQLEAAEVFIVLLCIHSLTSEFIQKKELVRALEKNGRIVPILVRSCFWQNNPVFAGLQGLPKNMKAISSFTDQDDAWTEVMEALHNMVEGIWKDEEKKTVATPAPQPKSKPPAAPIKLSIETPKRLAGLPDMVFVKGGTFMMGSPESEEGRFSGEIQHQVTLSDFEIGKYPVTQKLWREIMGNAPSHFKGGNLPVEQVTWDEVQEFLKKLNARYPGWNYRLPTEAEWEYAARGGQISKGFVYSGSNQLHAVGWYWENSGDKPLSGEWKYEKLPNNNCRTHPVGQKKPNELGLFDMSGNVYECCADWYGDYSAGPQTNPTGPNNGTYRVCRGGSWFDGPYSCRVACRNYFRPGQHRANFSGLRLAASPQSVG